MKKPVTLYTLLAYCFTWSIVLTGYGLYKKQHISYQQLNYFHTAGATGPHWQQ